MKVLITGVAGFLGSHLAETFIAKNHQVVGIDNLIGGYEDNLPSNLEFHKIDLINLNEIQPIFENVDLVVHAACTAYEGLSVFSPAFVSQNTYQITATTLSAAVRANVKKFVFMSSMARYGTQKVVPFIETATPNPQDPYGISKYAAELLVENSSRTHGMDHVILVPHNIIGPRQKYDDPYRNVASIMINRILLGKQPIIYGDGGQRRCFSFIQDVVNPIYQACTTSKADGKTVNIGPDEEFVTIIELAKKISKLLDRDFDPIFMPDRPQEVRDANCSADLARDLLGYKTTVSLEEGLQELINWIQLRGARDFQYHLPIEFTKPNTPRTWTDKLM